MIRQNPLDRPPDSHVRDMAEVPRQKKVAFFDGRSRYMHSVHAGFFRDRPWSDEQFRYIQYCLTDREKSCLLQESPAARRHFGITLTTLRFDGFRNGQRILMAFALPPAASDYLSPFGYRVATWSGGQIAQYAGFDIHLRFWRNGHMS